MSIHAKFIALQVASLFAVGNAGVKTDNDPIRLPTAPAKVKCAGGNSCSGKSTCKSASNTCSGQNSCKGKGWVVVASEKLCSDLGGKVVAQSPTKSPAKSPAK